MDEVDGTPVFAVAPTPTQGPNMKMIDPEEKGPNMKIADPSADPAEKVSPCTNWLECNPWFYFVLLAAVILIGLLLWYFFVHSGKKKKVGKLSKFKEVAEEDIEGKETFVQPAAQAAGPPTAAPMYAPIAAPAGGYYGQGLAPGSVTYPAGGGLVGGSTSIAAPAGSYYGQGLAPGAPYYPVGGGSVSYAPVAGSVSYAPQVNY
jgi:hypothetical protein